MTVRPATVDDAGAVARLMLQLGYELSPLDARPRLERILSRFDHRFLIADVDGDVAGWIHASLSEHIDAETCVLVEGLVVDREHRRKGIGAALLQHAEEWGRSHGCSLVRLRSTATRTKAHKFYRDLGYTIVKTQFSFVKPLNERGHSAVGRLVPNVQD